MSQQFQMARNAFLDFVKDLDEKTADIQATYFNNTLRWHAGHVVTVAETLLFGYPNQTDHVPENYNDLFATGTKPADWNTPAPSLTEIVNQLEAQKERMENVSDEYLQKDLDFTLPFGNFKTYGDIYKMLIQHEVEHLGKMKAMKQVVEKVG